MNLFDKIWEPIMSTASREYLDWMFQGKSLTAKQTVQFECDLRSSPADIRLRTILLSTYFHAKLNPIDLWQIAVKDEDTHILKLENTKNKSCGSFLTSQTLNPPEVIACR